MGVGNLSEDQRWGGVKVKHDPDKVRRESPVLDV